jgi:hypothetical protein
MGLDIRIPIGLMFTIVGLILVAFGAATNHSAIYGRSLGINVNLGWGGVMLGFGVFMLVLAYFARRRSGGK